jgi:transcription termination factor NusB
MHLECRKKFTRQNAKVAEVGQAVLRLLIYEMYNRSSTSPTILIIGLLALGGP